VCPLSFDARGICHALLGEEEVGGGGKRRHKVFSDFGGRREASDSSPEETAARECTEESLGSVFGPVATLIAILKNPSLSSSIVHKFPSGSSYHQFFALCHFWAAEPATFKCSLDSQAHRPARGAEKQSIMWIPLKAIIEAATRQGSRNSIVWHGRRQIRLRSCFSRSVCLAVQDSTNKSLLSLIQNGKASYLASLPKALPPPDLKSFGGTSQDLVDPLLYSQSMSYALSLLSQPPMR
jgi:8-oxo-dGTP pyrophosphatase MutT (NUDIX family)